MLDQASIKKIPWHDLTEYSVFDTLKELSLPFLWFVLSLVALNYLFLLGVICVGYTFLFGLRVAHNAFHRALGLPRWANDWVMLFISWILIGSNHAVYVTHMYHHKHCLEDGDAEGKLAHYSFWGAVLRSPIYPFQIHIKALKIASFDNQLWITLELLTSAIFHFVIFPTLIGSGYFIYLGMMLLANLLAPMFSTWIVHRDCEEQGGQARSCRSSTLNFLTGNMFYHHEHHLFPGVPSRRMPELGARLDAYTQETGLMLFGK